MMMMTMMIMMYTVHRTVSVKLSEEKEEVCVELRTSALNKTLHALCCALARPTDIGRQLSWYMAPASIDRHLPAAASELEQISCTSLLLSMWT